MTVNLERKEIGIAVKKVTDEMSVDMSGDLGLLEDETYSWDELNELKDELGKSTLDFAMQVKSMTDNEEVILKLGDNQKKFAETVTIFYRDMDDFSTKVKANRLLHEEKTGKVVDLNEFDLYNRCAMTYHVLFEELSALVTPTLSNLMIMLTDIIDEEVETSEETVVEEEVVVDE